MKKLKLVIIGTGKIAHSHMDVIKTFNDCEICSVYNRTKNKAINFANKYKITKVHDSIDKMINEIKPHGVLILVSFSEIYKVTRKIINYKIPFFLEKPPGLNLSQYKKLNFLCNKNKVNNIVGFNRRFYSIFLNGLKQLSSHGKIISFSIYGMERAWLHKHDKNFIKNLIFANAIHTIDLISYFGGEKQSFKLIKNNINKKKYINTILNIKFKNGIIGSYNINTTSPFYWSLKIFAQNASLIFNNFEEGYILDKNFKQTKILPDKLDKLYKPGFYRQFKVYRKLLLKNKIDPSAVDIKKCSQTINFAEKLNNIYLS